MNISIYGAPQLEVKYIQLPQGHTPTWENILPRAAKSRWMKLRLTAINKREFTLHQKAYGTAGCSIPFLTKQIKKLAKSYGGAVYERKGFPGIIGKWRIPMDALDDFVSYMRSDYPQYELEFDGLKDKYGDNNKDKQVGSSEHVPTIRTVQQRYRKSRLFGDLKIEPQYQFNNLRLYTVIYTGPKYGLILVSCNGRCVVKSHESASRNQYPKIGSIIASCNGYMIPQHAPFNKVLMLMKAMTKNPPVRVVFAEDDEFTNMFIEDWIPNLPTKSKSSSNSTVATNSAPSTDHLDTEMDDVSTNKDSDGREGVARAQVISPTDKTANDKSKTLNENDKDNKTVRNAAGDDKKETSEVKVEKEMVTVKDEDDEDTIPFNIETVSALPLIFERVDAHGLSHNVTVFLGRGNLTYQSTLLDAMVEAKTLSKAVFRSKTKSIVMEVAYGEKQTNLPITVEAARVYKLCDIINVGSDFDQAVKIQVRDAPEVDKDEFDVDF